MHAASKMIIGIIIFLAGIYWYVAGSPYLKAPGIQQFVPTTIGSTFQAFLVVFFGLFGLFLIFLGLVIAWIEYEDLKWSSGQKRKRR